MNIFWVLTYETSVYAERSLKAFSTEMYACSFTIGGRVTRVWVRATMPPSSISF
jgi:hypothetical protein